MIFFFKLSKPVETLDLEIPEISKENDIVSEVYNRTNRDSERATFKAVLKS